MLSLDAPWPPCPPLCSPMLSHALPRSPKPSRALPCSPMRSPMLSHDLQSTSTISQVPFEKRAIHPALLDELMAARHGFHNVTNSHGEVISDADGPRIHLPSPNQFLARDFRLVAAPAAPPAAVAAQGAQEQEPPPPLEPPKRLPRPHGCSRLEHWHESEVRIRHDCPPHPGHRPPSDLARPSPRLSGEIRQAEGTRCPLDGHHDRPRRRAARPAPLDPRAGVHLPRSPPQSPPCLPPYLPYISPLPPPYLPSLIEQRLAVRLYPAHLAGLRWAFSSTHRTIKLSARGFSERLPALIVTLLSELLRWEQVCALTASDGF